MSIPCFPNISHHRVEESAITNLRLVKRVVCHRLKRRQHLPLNSSEQHKRRAHVEEWLDSSLNLKFPIIDSSRRSIFLFGFLGFLRLEFTIKA